MGCAHVLSSFEGIGESWFFDKFRETWYKPGLAGEGREVLEGL